MAVEIILGNIESRIVGFLPEEAQRDLDKELSYKVKGVEHSDMVKNHIWDGYTRLYKESRQSFLTGLYSIVSEVLTKHGVEHRRRDLRTKPEVNLANMTFTPPPKYEARDYQQITIDRAYNRTRGILKIATGGGKTMCAAEIIGKVKTGPFMFYVLTKDLLDQAHETLSMTLNTPIGRIGGGECDIKMINICTVQTAIRAINTNKKFNISDYCFDEEDKAWWDEEDISSAEKLDMTRKVIQSCKGLFFDEVHHAAANTAKDVINASPAAYWKFGGSATPYREDGADLLIQALFGKKIVDINASYLIDRGFLCEPNIIFEPVKSNIGLHSWKSIYKNSVAKNDALNKHIAETAKFLMKNGLNTLILVGQKSQGEFIQKLIPEIPFVSSKTPKKQRKQALQDLRDKKIMGLIATSLADEGLDVPVLGSALLAGGGASATKVNQRIGRTLRVDRSNPNKKPIVIYYEHDAKYLSTHARRVRKILKEEPRFNILKSDGPDAIFRELEDLLGLNSSQKNVFD